jgi:hypothetical protein
MLQAVMADPDPEVRKNARWAVQQMRGEAAVNR